MQRITMIGGIIIILAVLGVVGTGVYVNRYEPYQKVVIKADKTDYSLDYFINMLAFEGKTSYSSVSQFISYSQYLGYIANSIAQRVENNQFKVEAAASQYQVTVSNDEVKQEIKKENLTTNKAIVDAIRTQLLETKLTDYFDKKIVPASVDQRDVQAMFLESQTQVSDITTRLTNGEKFGDIAGQVSLESVSKSKNGDFGYIPAGILPNILNNTSDTVLEDKAFSPDITPDTLVSVEDKDQNKSVGYWLVEITDKPVSTPTPTPTGATPTPSATPQPKVHILAMLLGSQEQALDIKGKLEAGGQGNDFATLAKANSQEANASTDSGDLGLLSKDEITTKLGSAVAALVFPENASTTLQTNKVSDPIQDTTQTTKGGFWLLKVSATENRTLDGDNRTTYVKNKLTDWENQVWNDNKDKAQDLLTDAQKSFAIAEAQKR
jgi:parvulin-like peptidyl-prolyl isomerase